MGVFLADKQLSVCNPTEKSLGLIRLCGKDPKAVTTQDMDGLDIRLVRASQYIMTWRSAVLYEDQHNSSSSWRLASPGETVKSKLRESKIKEEKSAWRCVSCNCPAVGQGWLPKNALRHLETAHGVKPPTLGHEFLTAHLSRDSLEANGLLELSCMMLRGRGDFSCRARVT
ncbi:hypothetical protein DAEQUDRAFT_200410 [Daedalea quercina L-15889]|uniref:Uncharacterized protein n=1 Tax=Daedalea quercina L-15889 TaxID=1314783 RepID=A0A165U9E7_9APHY|nr:hypothetical protein DAEQUDRAFT_200410 [Daedalea quercina L-15889]